MILYLKMVGSQSQHNMRTNKRTDSIIIKTLQYYKAKRAAFWGYKVVRRSHFRPWPIDDYDIDDTYMLY